MKYLCLGYYDVEKWDGMPVEEQESVASACRPHDERLYATGKVHSVASLGHRESVLIRPTADGPRTLDGPFTEAKETIGSFFIIEAETMEEAVRLASLHPAANWGGHLGFAIEVRPIEFYREAPTP